MSDETLIDADAAEAMRAAGRRRVELKQAVSAVEIAAARAAAEPGWAANLMAELKDLETALEQHTDEVEGPNGLLTELAEDAPRLIHKIEVVKNEHPALLDQAGRVIAAVRNDQEPDDIRAVVLILLVAIARHRQKGSDLVYDAYNVDIGGG